ncbi:DUF4167 domain-containing protein [Pannonibacter carbonis]|uniref:DUF4167 domain-containing protein n=1 Tax=Pannonibacter carbonis TaxID=2067569 RepID=UPI000D0ED926|nr:DUF4167 domain-containing protein [Pannonibacter carbonis]
MRGRGRSKGPSPLNRTFESNGPDVKIRGTALHVAEKYQQLARDAHAAGDRVMSENYYQHAEHYLRIVAAAQPNMLSANGLRYDGSQDDEDEEDQGGERYDQPERYERPERPERSERSDRQERPERSDRPERQERYERPERGERPDRGDRYERGDRPERSDRGDRPDRAERPERMERPERGDRPERRDRPDRPERTDRPERNDRPDRAERGNRVDRRERSDQYERAARPVDIVTTDTPQPFIEHMPVVELNGHGNRAEPVQDQIIDQIHEAGSEGGEDDKPRRRLRGTRGRGVRRPNEDGGDVNDPVADVDVAPVAAAPEALVESTAASEEVEAKPRARRTVRPRRTKETEAAAGGDA